MPQGSVGKRVRDRRKELGLSQGDLAKAAGLTQPTISSLERGESNTSGAIASIAHALKVSALWLETGLGEKELSARKLLRRTHSNGTQEEFFEVPIMPSEGSCGGLGNVPPHLPIVKGVEFFKHYKVNPECVFAVISDGDAMSPFVMNGYAVLFDSAACAQKLTSGVYAIKTPAGVRIKRLHIRADGSLVLANDNPDKTRFPDEVYPPDTSLTCMGRHFYLEG